MKTATYLIDGIEYVVTDFKTPNNKLFWMCWDVEKNFIPSVIVSINVWETERKTVIKMATETERSRLAS